MIMQLKWHNDGIWLILSFFYPFFPGEDGVVTVQSVVYNHDLTLYVPACAASAVLHSSL